MRNVEVFYSGEHWSKKKNNYRVKSMTPAQQECWAFFTRYKKDGDGYVFDGVEAKKVLFWALVEETSHFPDETTEISQTIVGVVADEVGLSIDYYQRYTPYSPGCNFPLGYSTNPKDAEKLEESAKLDMERSEKRRVRDLKALERIKEEANKRFPPQGNTFDERRYNFIESEMKKNGIDDDIL